MTAVDLSPPRDFDLPAGHLVLRREHLIAELERAGAARRKPGRRVQALVLAPVAVAVAVALLVAIPRQAPGPDFVDRALAAIGTASVVHAVVEHVGASDVVIDLSTGAEREVRHTIEYWYDERRNLLRTRYGGGLDEPMDSVARGVAPVYVDPAVAGFATRYREALASGRARVVGETTVDGRPAKRLEFRARPGGAVDEVAVDAETYHPLSFHTTYPPDGRRSPEWRVREIESLGFEPALFRAVKPARPRAERGEIWQAHEVSLSAAEYSLGKDPLWLGRAFRGRRLTSVELETATAELTDGSEVTGVLVRLVYGDVRVGLTRDAAGRYALTFNATNTTPPQGKLRAGGNDRDGWQGYLRYGDLTVGLAAPTKTEVIAAGRALRPHR